MVGSAITRRLSSEPCQLIRASRAEVDLTRQEQVEAWMAKARPEAVFVAAAKVGGIHANDTHPAEFLYDNLMIEANVIHAARRFGVEKLLFLGRSEEHTSELQSLMRIPYAVFCLKKKTNNTTN